jgi:hypothetical protein
MGIGVLLIMGVMVIMGVLLIMGVMVITGVLLIMGVMVITGVLLIMGVMVIMPVGAMPRARVAAGVASAVVASSTAIRSPPAKPSPTSSLRILPILLISDTPTR